MRHELPIACCHTAFTKEQRAEYKEIWEKLLTRRIGVAELEAGFRHQFPGDADTLRLVAGWVILERQCCPFLTFTVTAAAGGETMSLDLTGSGEVKSFLRTQLDGNIRMIAAGDEIGE